MSRLGGSSLLIACLLVGASLARAAEEDSLTFSLGKDTVAVLTKDQLTAKIKPQVETFLDPRYGKKKSYRCLPMSEVMDVAYGPAWRSSPYTEAVLTAHDGYDSVSSAAKLGEPGGCLAVADNDFPGWEPVGRERASPGPFYLTWSGKEQSTENDYPWPYQLVSIDLVKFEDRFPGVPPKAPVGSPAWRGFEIFKGQCLRCHAINQDGGKVGPDLNAPQSVTAYRSKKWIKDYIRQPSKFRHTQMPDNLHLTDRNLEDLYQYLLAKSKDKEKKW